MLSENLKHFRKAKGLSQEELAIKLHIVRQTVSKWEKGLSVPDSGMLIRLAEALDTSVTELLGETAGSEPASGESAELKAIAAKLELLNEQFAARCERQRKLWRAVFILFLIRRQWSAFGPIQPLLAGTTVRLTSYAVPPWSKQGHGLSLSQRLS